jgi:glucose/arabinose dehydrogenase
MTCKRSKYKITLALLILVISHCTSCAQTVGGRPQAVDDVFLPEVQGVDVQVWIDDLRIPWSLIFLPDGRALISERPGNIRLVKHSKLSDKLYAKVEVAHIGEGGLMGLALHPLFPKEPYLYAMHTYKEGDTFYNRVIRLKDFGNEGQMDKVIVDRIPGGIFHNGGRIAFGPDGMLYITTGEIFEAMLAQDLTSLGGKSLRVTPEGSIPEDNPFQGSPIYSYGHRNPQGICWDPSTKRMYASEHGPSGEFGRFGHDEINMIAKGGNYGWPKVIGAGGSKPFIDPVVVWKDATPPSGMTFYKGDLMKQFRGNLFVATLRSESLIRVILDTSGDKVIGIERWFARGPREGRFGRIRDVVEGHDGALYFLTNNTDGRGTPIPGDDKIYRIVPKR